MTLDTWLAFVAASTILLLIPGPTVMLVVGFALARGAARSWWAAFGVALGDATALGCSLLGLGAFLQASAELFTLLKWGGALYLVWIGLGMLRAKPKALHADGGGDSRSSLSMLAQAYVVTALNPKSIFFFVAFVPQFLTPGPDMAAQMLTVLCTFVPLAFLNAAAYAVLAGTARRAARRPGVMAAFNRVGGSCMIGAGVWTAVRES